MLLAPRKGFSCNLVENLWRNSASQNLVSIYPALPHGENINEWIEMQRIVSRKEAYSLLIHRCMSAPPECKVFKHVHPVTHLLIRNYDMVLYRSYTTLSHTSRLGNFIDTGTSSSNHMHHNLWQKIWWSWYCVRMQTRRDLFPKP